jgi:hypothetical protein
MSQEHILERSLGSTDAAARLDITVDELERRRDAGMLLGLWERVSETWVYPSFQFAPGVSKYGLELLLSILASRAGFSPSTDDREGWTRAFWLFQPNERLSLLVRASKAHGAMDPVSVALTIFDINRAARAPADALADDPLAVIELAQSLAADG